MSAQEHLSNVTDWKNDAVTEWTFHLGAEGLTKSAQETLHGLNLGLLETHLIAWLEKTATIWRFGSGLQSGNKNQGILGSG